MPVKLNFHNRLVHVDKNNKQINSPIREAFKGTKLNNLIPRSKIKGIHLYRILT